MIQADPGVGGTGPCCICRRSENSTDIPGSYQKPGIHGLAGADFFPPGNAGIP